MIENFDLFRPANGSQKTGKESASRTELDQSPRWKKKVTEEVENAKILGKVVTAGSEMKAQASRRLLCFFFSSASPNVDEGKKQQIVNIGFDTARNEPSKLWCRNRESRSWIKFIR